MTREEAIYELKNAAWLGTDHSRARTEEAVDMAISALNSLEEVYAKGYDDGFTQAEVNFENDKALSQEPCDDAISQNQSNACSILDDECPYPHKHCWECPLHYQYELAKHELDKNVDLPSVTQKSGVEPQESEDKG